MKITKLEAAGQLLDSAIDHFLRGEWVPSIHCAGAAEELCGREWERRGGKTVTDETWEEHDFAGIVSTKKEFVKAANMYRDWVKHTNDTHSHTIELEDWHALFSLVRAVNAYSRFLDSGAVPPRRSIAQIGEWYGANADRVEMLVNSLPG